MEKSRVIYAFLVFVLHYHRGAGFSTWIVPTAQRGDLFLSNISTFQSLWLNRAFVKKDCCL